MYTIFERRGVVVRNSDGMVVAPTPDDQGQDYLDWLDWCSAGNTPTIGVEVADQTEKHISKLSFLNRFTPAELVAVELAKIDDPSAALSVRQFAASIRMWQMIFDAAQYIDLAAQQTIDGVNQFETNGIIGQGRATEILSAPVSEDEKP